MKRDMFYNFAYILHELQKIRLRFDVKSLLDMRNSWKSIVFNLKTEFGSYMTYNNYSPSE